MSGAPFDPLLSVFSCATDADTVADHLLSEIMARILSGELAELTLRISEAYRGAGGGAAGKRAIEAIKKRLPAVTLAGTFTRRANAAWRDPSGLVPFDLDNLSAAELAEAREILTACPWVAILWTSPSGAGLKGAVLVPGLLVPDLARYKTAWRAVTRWLASIYLENDPAGKDAARLAFLCHDAGAYYNPEAAPFDLDAWAEAEPVAPAPAPRSERAPIPFAEIERRAFLYIRAMPPSVQGNNGSAALVAVARALRDGFDLPAGALWHLLEGWNLERANPSWSREELEHALETVAGTPSTRGRGWLLDEFREAPRASAPAPAAVPEPWTEPEPLGCASEPPPFDAVAMLPADVPELAAMVEAVAESVQVPRELVAGGIIGLAALACARAVEVQCSADWREPSPLWFLILLLSGERKSSIVRILKRPFDEWTTREHERLAAPVARYMERRRGKEARLSAVRTRAAKESDSEARNRLEREASDLAADLEAMPEKMAAPDLVMQSTTPEGLRDALEVNGERVGIVSAEANAADLLGARYSDSGPNYDLLLCGHAGDAITTRRAGGRSIRLESPAVGLVLAIQPEAVREILTDRGAGGRGLINRMLLIRPPSLLGARLLDPPPVPPGVLAWWDNSIRGALALLWPGRVIIGDDSEPVRSEAAARVLTLDPEARRILWALRADLEPKLAEGGELADVRGFASKLPGACVRLALAFTILGDPQAEAVGAEAMRAACAWAPYLLAHHRAILGEAAEGDEFHHARRLWRALEREGKPTANRSDLFHLVRDSACPDMDTFAPVLALLVEHGAVRRMPGEKGKNGRPADLYEVNPTLLGVLGDKSPRQKLRLNPLISKTTPNPDPQGIATQNTQNPPEGADTPPEPTMADDPGDAELVACPEGGL